MYHLLGIGGMMSLTFAVFALFGAILVGSTRGIGGLLLLIIVIVWSLWGH